MAVVAAVGVGAFFVVRGVLGNQRHAVAIAIEATKYDEGASRIPLHVTGKNSSGAAVDEIACVDASGTGLELAAGEYDVAPAASPLLSDGNVYKVPEGSVHVSVGSDGARTATGSVGEQKKDDKAKAEGDGKAEGSENSGEGKITFTVADSKAVSDAQLADARRYAEEDAESAGKADELAKKAEEKRSKATGGAKNDQERLAFAFVRTYFDSVKLGEADANGYLKMTQKENWEKSCRSYIAKDTKLYNEFVPEKTKDSKNPQKDYPWGRPNAWMIFSKAKVVESADKKTKVNVEYYGGNGSIKTNYKESVKPSSADIVITFDDDNKIVGLERAKSN